MGQPKSADCASGLQQAEEEGRPKRKNARHIFLQELGLATGLSAGEAAQSWSAHSIFSLRVELTEAGSADLAAVGRVIFSYVRLVAREGVSRWAWDERRRLARVRFDYRDRPNPFGLVRTLSSCMQYFGRRDLLLAAAAVAQEWDEAAVKGVLAALVPESARAMHAAREHEAEASSSERWYGTKFAAGPLPAELLAAWQSDWEPSEGHSAAVLKVPAPNPFVPDDFSVIRPDAWPQGWAGDNGGGGGEGLAPPGPRVVAESGLGRLWYAPDHLGLKQPKAVVILALVSEMTTAGTGSEGRVCACALCFLQPPPAPCHPSTAPRSAGDRPGVAGSVFLARRGRLLPPLLPPACRLPQHGARRQIRPPMRGGAGGLSLRARVLSVVSEGSVRCSESRYVRVGT